MIALLTNLEEHLGADSRFVHIGLTSSDVWDTAVAMQLRDAADLLIAGQECLREALRQLAVRHKDTLIVGRTHGVHAEPTTFGLKAAIWFAEAGRNLEHLRQARATIAVGQISGAVGTFAHVDLDIEEDVSRELGLGVEPVSNQVIQRDRHAEYCTTLAVAAASLEKIALEVRGLQRTEVLEAEEPFSEGQKGSSAMPHKRNPELAELDYLLDLTAYVVEGLQINPQRMQENIERSYGLIYSQRVLLALTESGLAGQAAYELVQTHAMRAWRERRSFFELLAGDPAFTDRISRDDLKRCFDPAWYVRHVDAVFRRVGLA
ncbi:MAG: lyase family protein [Candidatus Rokuibacteriota bacterium]